MGATAQATSVAAALRTRRNPFTGRVSYIDPASVRGLRARVPRALLVATSALSLVAGIACAAGTGGPHQSSVNAVSSDVPVLAPVLATAEDLGPPSGPERR